MKSREGLGFDVWQVRVRNNELLFASTDDVKGLIGWWGTGQRAAEQASSASRALSEDQWCPSWACRAGIVIATAAGDKVGAVKS